MYRNERTRFEPDSCPGSNGTCIGFDPDRSSVAHRIDVIVDRRASFLENARDVEDDPSTNDCKQQHVRSRTSFRPQVRSRVGAFRSTTSTDRTSRGGPKTRRSRILSQRLERSYDKAFEGTDARAWTYERRRPTTSLPAKDEPSPDGQRACRLLPRAIPSDSKPTVGIESMRSFPDIAFPHPFLDRIVQSTAAASISIIQSSPPRHWDGLAHPSRSALGVFLRPSETTKGKGASTAW